MTEKQDTPASGYGLFRPGFRTYLLLALAIILVDQIVKLVVKTQMHLGEEFRVLGDVFKIHFVENPGAAFGMTLGKFGISNPDVAKLVLTLFSILAVGVIIWYLYKIRHYRTALPYWVAIILAGALGNIIDRVFYGAWFAEQNAYEGGLLYGQVVDMFYVDIWQGVLPSWVPFFGGQFYAFWPIFNIADAAISTGILAILIWQKRLFVKPDAQPAAHPQAPYSPGTEGAATQAQDAPAAQ
ncbi:MAG: lipoprotein signal peptidase [Bacteroidetes bacterium]|jgi:signal peptidase II|nr:lipoprotein signal peptidase [Bacteroidota bacterium]